MATATAVGAKKTVVTTKAHFILLPLPGETGNLAHIDLWVFWERTIQIGSRKVPLASRPVRNANTMSNSNTLPPIQFFAEARQLDNVSNFLSFSDSIVSIARGYGLEGYLDGTITRPAGNVAPPVLAAGSDHEI
ncbi:hypothetical protein FB446DRAFT_784514 [Lentinula raphanica]|nr:hypothetical protein FB446DRAFT_784514 [Lentinula raphanica]